MLTAADSCCYCYSMNAPVMVELEGETDPLKIAMKELKLVITWLRMCRMCYCVYAVSQGTCVLCLWDVSITLSKLMLNIIIGSPISTSCYFMRNRSLKYLHAYSICYITVIVYIISMMCICTCVYIFASFPIIYTYFMCYAYILLEYTTEVIVTNNKMPEWLN